MNNKIDSITDTKDCLSVNIQFLNGQYNINGALINSLYMIEDIFSPFIYGCLTFTDVNDLLSMGPITGNESITIQYGSDGETNVVTKVFTVYKISEIASVGGGGGTSTKNILEIHFFDPFFMLLGIKQFSRSWKDTAGHDIIKHILTKTAEIDEKFVNMEEWEECKEIFDYYYMPWWTCIDSIKWLMKRMSSKSTNNSGYCLFANSNGLDDPNKEGMSTLNFMTIDTMLSKKEKLKVSDEDDSIYRFIQEETSGENNPELDSNRIMSWSINGVDKNSIKGIAGGHYYGFDNLTKSPIDSEYTYSSMLDRHTVLGSSGLFMDISEPDAGRFFTGESKEDLVNNIAYDDWVKRYVMQSYLTIVVPGKHKRYCGSLIEVKFPAAQIEGFNDPANLTMSGGYLIRTVVNYFSPQDTVSYRQKLVLCKNGYNKQYDDLLEAKNKNLLTELELGK